nr:retrovirus-related Pol polyprotein from transposon TNT 1-94 [Tanacetum cinerariifolium]
MSNHFHKQPTLNLFQHPIPSNHSGWSGHRSECSGATKSDSVELCSGIVAAGNKGAHIRAGNVNAGQRKPIKCFNCIELGHITRNCAHSKRQQNSDYFKDKILLMQAQENGATKSDSVELCSGIVAAGNKGAHIRAGNVNADVDDHPVRDLALNDDNIFQADEYDAFDLDVDDEPTAQSIFMANLSSAGPTNQQAGPSNASILSETQLKGKMSCVTSNDATPKVPACAKNETDVQPIPPRQRKNRVIHHSYLNRLRGTLDTLCEIAEEARSK